MKIQEANIFLYINVKIFMLLCVYFRKRYFAMLAVIWMQRISGGLTKLYS